MRHNGLLLVSLAAIAGKTRAICVTQGSSTGDSNGYNWEIQSYLCDTAVFYW